MTVRRPEDTTVPADWDPRSPEVQQDQIAAYDALRAHCPVAHDDYLGYTLLSHADVAAAALDPQTFSNRVSDRHVAVPNGLDGPEHTAFRRINDAYFTPERMAAAEPVLRTVIRELSLPANVHCQRIEAAGARSDAARSLTARTGQAPGARRDLRAEARGAPAR